MLSRSRNVGCFGIVILLLVAWFALRLFTGGGPQEASVMPAEPGQGQLPGMEQEAEPADAQGALAPLAPIDEQPSADGAAASDAAADGEAQSADPDGQPQFSDAELGDVSWTILEAVDLGDSLQNEAVAAEPLVAEGKLVGVRFTVENGTTDPLTLVGMKLVDDQSRAYEYLPSALAYVEESEACEIVTVEPGEAVTCTAIYDVAADAAGLAAVATDLNMLSGNEQAILLTLE